MRQVSDIMSSTSSYGYYLLPNTYYLLPNTYYLIKELLNLLDHHTQAEYNDMVLRHCESYLRWLFLWAIPDP